MGIKKKKLIQLNIIVFFYPVIAVLAKLASRNEFLSFKFNLYFFLEVCCLFLYALYWRNILKYLDVSIVYSNRALVIIYNMFIGMALFNEQLTVPNFLGALLIIAGIGVVVKDGA